jgi:hypothetical protein
MPKTKKKRNEDNDESTKWWRPATVASFDFSYHAPSTPKRPEPISTFKKGSTVDTVLLPGLEGPRVSPARSKVDEGFPRCPPGRNDATRKRHRVRVEQADIDFSWPSPTKNNSGAKECHHQASLPTCKRHHGLVVNIPLSLREKVRTKNHLFAQPKKPFD